MVYTFSFDIISTRLDWWTGRVGGRTGIFPSNYAEVLHHPLPTWSTAPPPATATTARPAKQTESAPKYMPMPYKAVHHPENAPNPTGTRPQQQRDQQDHSQEPQESKYSHIKNTVSAYYQPTTHLNLLIATNRWQTLLRVALALGPGLQSADRSFVLYSNISYGESRLILSCTCLARFHISVYHHHSSFPIGCPYGPMSPFWQHHSLPVEYIKDFCIPNQVQLSNVSKLPF